MCRTESVGAFRGNAPQNRSPSALLAEYDILLLDEPFKGLDAETKKRAMDYTKKMCRGKTVICVTHDQEEALALEGEILHYTSMAG